MADQYQAAVDKTLEQVGNPTVFVVTDVHTYADNVNKYAIELAKKTGKPLGLESFTRGEEANVRAFEQGDITRTEFLGLVNPAVDNPMAMSLESYIGKKRAAEYYSDIADAIQSGVKVRGLGTVAGTHTALNKIENVDLVEDLLDLSVRIDIDFVKFQRDGVKGKIEQDPKAFFKQYLNQTEKLFNEMPPEKREEFSSRIEKLNETRQADANGEYSTSSDYWGGIKDVFETMNPLFEAKNDKMIEWGSIRSSTINNPTTLADRQAADHIITNKVSSFIESSGGAVVVYGRGHTTHGKRDGFDLDQGLRERGIETAILDPMVSRDRQIPDTFVDGAKREDTYRQIDEANKSVIDEGDPNRYTVELEAGYVNEVKTVASVSKPDTSIMSL